MTFRLIAACVALTVVGCSTVQPRTARGTAAETAVSAQPVEVAAQPAPEPRARRSDIYDVAAPIVTVLKAPGNIGLCAVGTGLAIGLMAATIGSGYRAAARVMEEGCGGPWVIHAEDLRPAPPRVEPEVFGYPR